MTEHKVTMESTLKVLLEQKKYSTLKDILVTMNPSDVAELFGEIADERLPRLFRLLPKELAAETFIEMQPEEQELLRSAFAEFIKEEITPNAAKWDEENHTPLDLMPKMGEIGILGVFVPEEYGGVGLGHTERLMALEEIARHSAGLAMMVFTHQLGMAAILDFGTEEQKKHKKFTIWN